MRQTISISDKAMTTVAGILLTAYQLRKLLGLGDPGPTGISEALEVSRSQMYVMAEPVRGLVDAARGPGRPAALSDADDNPSLLQQLAVSVAFGQWLVEHPGAVYRGQERMHCSDQFRSFVVDLLSPGGIGDGLTREKAGAALGMSMHTLTHWLSAKLPEPRQEPPAVTADDSTGQSPESVAAGSGLSSELGTHH